MRKNHLPQSKIRLGFLIIVLGLFFSGSTEARAAERTDILIGLKTLPMLDHAIVPPVVVGIIYDPSDPTSKADAESIKAVFDAGVQTPDGEKVTGLLLALSEIQKLSQVKVAFVTQGLKEHFTTIAQAAAEQNVLTMSTDLDCVRANKCVLGIVSKPVVEIYFSRAASEISKIVFDSAFTMLIKKV